MTTLYIAGPMTGIPEFNYPAFREAEAQLRAAGYGVLNPVDSEKYNDTGAPQEWHWYMRHALRIVLDADGIALLPRWQMSKGAQLEVQVANALTVPTASVTEWLSQIEDGAA